MRPKILCVINSLEGGGAERVFAQVSPGLARAFPPGAVEIALLDRAPELYASPAGIRKQTLDCEGDFARSVTRLAALARSLRPDLIVSFLARANCAAIAAGLACGAPVIASERVHTSSHFGADFKGRANRLTLRAAYPLAQRMIAPSQGVAADLQRHYGVARDRLRVIYNPLDLDGVRRAGAEAPALALPEDFCVAVGRLAPNKNHALLIRALARAPIKAHLIILGEGPQRADLEALAATLGLADRVHLPGFVSNPHAIAARARFYVSASNAEGFPNALAEAMALGLPAAHTDCPAGPAEILSPERPIGDGLTQARCGLLVPCGDEAAMARAMAILQRPDVRVRLSEQARRRAQDFAADIAIARWVDVTRDMLAQRGRK